MKSKEALKRIETAFPFNREGKTSVYREYTNSIYPYYEDFDLVMRDLEMLEQYKKIEEELGIDLITLFKTISQGYIFVREHNTEEKEIVAEDVRPNFLTHTFDFKEPRKEIGKGRPFSRIGKTFALTREELENE